MDNPIRRSAAPVSAADMAMLEHRLGLTLPADYRDFLFAHNGGVPKRTGFTYPNKKGVRRKCWVRHFTPVGRDGLIDLDWPDLEAGWTGRPRGLPAGVVPVGAAYYEGNEGFVCLGCDGDAAGQVFFRPDTDPHKNVLYPVANSWSAFLTGLVYEGKSNVCKDALEAGDVPAFRAWLEANPKKLQNDALREIDVGRTAVEENNWPAVLTLIEFGVDASWLFVEALDYHRYDLAQRLLRSGGVDADTVAGSLTRGRMWLFHLPELLDELIAAGADVSHQSESGETPLHRAVEARSEAGVRLLLDKGADPTAADDDGRTPLGLARRLEETGLTAVLQEGEAAWAKRPRPAEADVREFDLHGVTFRKSGPSLTLDAIKAFEAAVKLDFPPEYRWLLLQANGGVPSAHLLPLDSFPGRDDEDEDEDEAEDDDGGDGESFEVRVAFLPLRKGDAAGQPEPEGDEESDEEYALGYPVEDALGWYHDGSNIPRGTVPIASLAEYSRFGGAELLLLGCGGRNRGKLFAFEHSPTPLNLTLPEFVARLAEFGVRPKSAGERIADAIEARNLAAVRAVLAEGEKVAWTTRDGRLPIRMACEAGFDDAVVAMAEVGGAADIGQLLTEAANADRPDLLRRLFAVGDGPPKKALRELLDDPTVYRDPWFLEQIEARGVDLAKRIRKQPVYVRVAAEAGSVAGLQFLLARGADPHAHDQERGTTLLHAAARGRGGDPAAVVAFLLGRGVVPNTASSDGHTALHEAAAAGNLAACKLLIDAGEDLHAKHPRYPAGMTPDQAAKMARRAARSTTKSLAELGRLGDDEDGPAPPDTSEPAGEKAAELMGLADQMRGAMDRLMPALGEKLAAMAAGDWGAGPSAAEWAGKYPLGQAIIAELEAYAAMARPPRG